VPNNFLLDANCIADFNLESGALAADSKGGNDLANVGVDEDLVNFKEGACSGLFVRADSDRLYRADANLDAGFPLRSDAASTSFSFPNWIKLTAIGLNQYILCKTGAVGSRQMIIMVDSNNKVNLYISSNGTNWNYYTHASALAANVWYHIAVTHNDADHAYRIRIWDDTAGAILGVDKTGNTVHPFLSAAAFYLGYSSSTLTLGGNLDEVVVFNDVLSVAEIDAIRAGTYGASGITVEPDVLAIGLAQQASEIIFSCTFEPDVLAIGLAQQASEIIFSCTFEPDVLAIGLAQQVPEIIFPCTFEPDVLALGLAQQASEIIFSCTFEPDVLAIGLTQQAPEIILSGTTIIIEPDVLALGLKLEICNIPGISRLLIVRDKPKGSYANCRCVSRSLIID
jgi:hypothetical protein